MFALYSFYCFVVTLVHFGSFFQLGSLFKTLTALVLILAYGLAAFIGVNTALNPLTTTNATASTIITEEYSLTLHTAFFLRGMLSEKGAVWLDLGLLWLLLWLLNRQSELIQRVSFKCDQSARAKVRYAREQKELATWLIEVVLPAHVVNHVQERRQYSRNHACVGVLFVSLCNFWEFFEESYEGGRELLRVLNEITVDFDRLFDEPKYKRVEKIKSIGSTFMIASGLSTSDSAG